jgi:hypothetical protein
MSEGMKVNERKKEGMKERKRGHLCEDKVKHYLLPLQF